MGGSLREGTGCPVFWKVNCICSVLLVSAGRVGPEGLGAGPLGGGDPKTHKARGRALSGLRFLSLTLTCQRLCKHVQLLVHPRENESVRDVRFCASHPKWSSKVQKEHALLSVCPSQKGFTICMLTKDNFFFFSQRRWSRGWKILHHDWVQRQKNHG